jgi:hypothetical protein
MNRLLREVRAVLLLVRHRKDILQFIRQVAHGTQKDCDHVVGWYSGSSFFSGHFYRTCRRVVPPK